jgi:hypothetical protein
MKKLKPKKPRWIWLFHDSAYLMECIERPKPEGRIVHINGVAMKEKRIKYLAKWFAQAVEWLEEK